MNELVNYLNLGINHILDLNGLDHFYFILSFGLLYAIKEWKTLLGLVTAFTIGHSITLAISVLEIFTIDSDLIETFIPITILASCLYNFYAIGFKQNENKKQNISVVYGLLLFFGLIHGMGFSNYLKSILFEEDSIITPLLGFNLGIEVAQVIIVLGFVLLKELFYQFIPKYWVHLSLNMIITFFVIKMFF